MKLKKQWNFRNQDFFFVYVPFFTVNFKNQPSVIETFLSVKDADSDAKLFVERNGIYSSRSS